MWEGSSRTRDYERNRHKSCEKRQKNHRKQCSYQAAGRQESAGQDLREIAGRQGRQTAEGGRQNLHRSKESARQECGKIAEAGRRREGGKTEDASGNPNKRGKNRKDADKIGSIDETCRQNRGQTRCEKRSARPQTCRGGSRKKRIPIRSDERQDRLQIDG
ncbi:hypothetical protein GCM10011430_09830 [Oxalicibacterium solurbis]|uniref:Uncharacterized protein n=1 Tax=Oxalicibacterium solurbis TaxID=69280 RepID=A0A8J3F590_9BURK|nr:hypothetical protein GCM10011430_09830 [Oxalicibacterium solurbis]